MVELQRLDFALLVAAKLLAQFCRNLECRWLVVFSVNAASFAAIGGSVSKCARPKGISGAADGALIVTPMRSGFGRELRLAVHQLHFKFKQNPCWGSLRVVFRRLDVVSLQCAVCNLCSYCSFFSSCNFCNLQPAPCSLQSAICSLKSDYGWRLKKAADLNSCRLQFAVYKLVTESAPTVDKTCVIALLIWF